MNTYTTYKTLSFCFFLSFTLLIDSHLIFYVFRSACLAQSIQLNLSAKSPSIKLVGAPLGTPRHFCSPRDRTRPSDGCVMVVETSRMSGAVHGLTVLVLRGCCYKLAQHKRRSRHAVLKGQITTCRGCTHEISGENPYIFLMNS